MGRMYVLIVLMVLVLFIVVATTIAAIMNTAARTTPPMPAAQPAAAPLTPSTRPAKTVGAESKSKSGESKTADATSSAKQSSTSAAPASAAVEPAAEPRPTFLITRIPVNGQDLADLLNLMMWKFRFNLPRGDYTCYLWLENWTADADRPEKVELASMHGIWDSGEIVLKLPTPDDRRQMVRVGNAVRRASDAAPIDLRSPWNMENLEREPIELNQDIYLITFTHNEGTIAQGGRIGVHFDHDLTTYVKAKFAPGPFVPFKLDQLSDENN